ncbi:MAG: DUF1501 domain-containing protein [Bacteroidota bacterium]
MSNRRDFLKLSSLASASVLMPGFLRAMRFHPLAKEGKKLVVIQWSGGNDGLNCLVPFEDDRYYQARPTLGISPDKVLKLNDYQGFNPALAPLRELYDQGYMSLINSVGYPNPDRSHFRSMDIWHTASGSDQYWDSGWLGRYLDHSCSGCAKPHTVLEIDESLSLAVKGEHHSAIAVTDPRRLHRNTQDPWLVSLSNEGQQAAHPDLGFLYKTMTETIESAEYIHAQHKIHRSTIDYPKGNPLARQLKLVAELINSGAETSVYYTSLPGFDTHVNQRNKQNRLLGQYADAVAAFVKDLKQNHQLDNTVIMTFSEFGRRVDQNASGGTDHGKANSLFLIGGQLRTPGFVNAAPDLGNLDDGDVSWEIDFRRIYATLLKDWLGADDEAILQGHFKGLRLV